MRIRRLIPLLLATLVVTSVAIGSDATVADVEHATVVLSPAIVAAPTAAARSTFLALGAMYLNGPGATIGVAHRFRNGAIALGQAVFVRDHGDDVTAHVDGASVPAAMGVVGPLGAQTCYNGDCHPPDFSLPFTTPESSRVGVAVTFIFGDATHAIAP